MDLITQQQSPEHFKLLLLFCCNANNCNNFVTFASTRLRPTEDDADASKHVAALTINKILFIYIYTHTHTHTRICCAFVGLDNKLYKTQGTYIKTTERQVSANVEFAL